MHRLAVTALAAALPLALVGCSSDNHAEHDDHDHGAPPAVATSSPSGSARSDSTPSDSTPPAPQPTATETPPGGEAPAPGQTDPEKLDPAILPPDQLPGWEKGDAAAEYADTTVEPAACTELHHLTVGKIASDMGAMAAYTKDDLFFQEFLEVVDKGATTVDEVEKLVVRCPSFTMVDADERTPVTVSRFDAPGIGDKSLGIKLTMQGEAPVDLLVIVAGHKDVLLTTSLQGEQTPPALANELTREAMDRAKTSI